MSRVPKHRCLRCGQDCKRNSSLVAHLQNKTVCAPILKNARRSTLLKKCLLEGGGGQNDNGNAVANPNFGNVVCLGEYGGVSCGNLSCYLLQIGTDEEDGRPEYLCLDGGSPIDGLWIYNRNHPDDKIDLKQIKGFVVSHCHLDHVAGLAVMTPATYGWKPRPALIASKKVMKELRAHIFNDILWPSILWDNFDRLPLLLTSNVKDENFVAHEVAKVRNVTVSADYVFHGNDKGSSVFYITDNVSKKTVVYFGDVTSVEHMKMESNPKARLELDHVWNRVAKMDVTSIFMECAFTNKISMLFGHMNPKLLKEEIERYISLRPSQSPFNLFVTHMKPAPNGDETDRETIMSEVTKSLKDYAYINIMFLRQGERRMLARQIVPSTPPTFASASASASASAPALVNKIDISFRGDRTGSKTVFHR